MTERLFPSGIPKCSIEGCHELQVKFMPHYKRHKGGGLCLKHYKAYTEHSPDYITYIVDGVVTKVRRWREFAEEMSNGRASIS